MLSREMSFADMLQSTMLWDDIMSRCAMLESSDTAEKLELKAAVSSSAYLNKLADMAIQDIETMQAPLMAVSTSLPNEPQ